MGQSAGLVLLGQIVSELEKRLLAARAWHSGCFQRPVVRSFLRANGRRSRRFPLVARAHSGRSRSDRAKTDQVVPGAFLPRCVVSPRCESVLDMPHVAIHELLDRASQVDRGAGGGLADTLGFLPDFVLEAQNLTLELVPLLASVEVQEMQAEPHLLASGAKEFERVRQVDGVVFHGVGSVHCTNQASAIRGLPRTRDRTRVGWGD